jgi:transcription antitermination factor NusB
MDTQGVEKASYPRRLSREIAFQFLYQHELNPRKPPAGDDAGPELELGRPELVAFARDCFETLYYDDSDAQANPVAHGVLLRHWLESPEPVEFAISLIEGVLRHRQALDCRLAEAAENWSLERMAPVDRVILRLGAYEILHGDTPDAVAVDEAVDLAKRFGAARSGQFVNGILDHLMPGGKHEQPQGDQ